MDAIGSTIGNMAVNQIAEASAASSSVVASSLRTQQAMSAVTDQVLPVGLGGVGYGLTAPETAMGQLGSSGYNPYNSSSARDAAVQLMELTPDDVRRLTPVNGPSIVGSPFSPEVTGDAVPYPQISVRSLPEGTAATDSALNGLDSFMAFNRVGQALGGAAVQNSGFSNAIDKALNGYLGAKR